MKPPSPDALSRRARRGTLEVEHLLAAARQPSLELAETLEALTVELKWPSAPCPPQVPMGSWAAVVSRYCRGGRAAIEDALRDPALCTVALSLLEALADPPSLDAVARLAARLSMSTAEDLAFAHEVSGTLNFLGIDGVAGGAPEILEIGAFLNRLLSLSDLTTAGRVLCALRYFGDSESLRLIRALPTLPPEWDSMKSAATRAINKRLKLLN